MRIAIYGSRRQQAAFGKVAEFLRNLAENGDSVVMHGKLYDHLMDARFRFMNLPIAYKTYPFKSPYIFLYIKLNTYFCIL